MKSYARVAFYSKSRSRQDGRTRGNSPPFEAGFWSPPYAFLRADVVSSLISWSLRICSGLRGTRVSGSQRRIELLTGDARFWRRHLWT